MCDIDHLRPDLKIMNFSDMSVASQLTREIKANTVDGVLQLRLCCLVHHREHGGVHKETKRSWREPQIALYQRWREQHGACAVCHLSVAARPLYCFDADHITPVGKVDSVSVMVYMNEYSLDDVAAKLAKCTLLCANCHRKHTLRETTSRNAARC